MVISTLILLEVLFTFLLGQRWNCFRWDHSNICANSHIIVAWSCIAMEGPSIPNHEITCLQNKLLNWQEGRFVFMMFWDNVPILISSEVVFLEVVLMF
jgi:hypothetical protein